jgi:glycosyltransferase involved in cell wall biosynthesis
MATKQIAVVCPSHPASKTGIGMRIRLTIRALQTLGDVHAFVLRPSAGDAAVGPADRTTVIPIHVRSPGPLETLTGIAHRMPRRTLAFDPAARTHDLRAAAPSGVDLWWAIGDVAAHVSRPIIRSPAVVDFTDFEGDRWVTIAAGSSGPSSLRLARELGARYDRWALRRQIRELLKGYDLGIVSSDVDRRRSGADLHVVDNAVASPDEAPPASASTTRTDELLFLGFIDYPPNSDALGWLVEAIMPDVWRHIPAARLRIAGRGTVPAAARHDDRITVLGEVDDATAEFRRAGILVVPLRHGSGSRIKVIEAWANGLPVISTAKGVEGLGARAGRHYLRAETPSDFTAAISELLSEPHKAAELAAAGRALHQSRYSEERFCARIIEMAAIAADRSPDRSK